MKFFFDKTLCLSYDTTEQYIYTKKRHKRIFLDTIWKTNTVEILTIYSGSLPLTKKHFPLHLPVFVNKTKRWVWLDLSALPNSCGWGITFCQKTHTIILHCSSFAIILLIASYSQKRSTFGLELEIPSSWDGWLFLTSFPVAGSFGFISVLRKRNDYVSNNTRRGNQRLCFVQSEICFWYRWLKPVLAWCY